MPTGKRLTVTSYFRVVDEEKLRQLLKNFTEVTVKIKRHETKLGLISLSADGHIISYYDAENSLRKTIIEDLQAILPENEIVIIREFGNASWEIKEEEYAAACLVTKNAVEFLSFEDSLIELAKEMAKKEEIILK